MALCAVLFVTACGPSAGPKAATPPAPTTSTPGPDASASPPQTEAKADSSASASSSGTKLRYFRNVLDSDQPQKPSFEIEMERFSMTEDNVYVVEKAHAVAYGKDGSETIFEADGGQFDDNTKMTRLNGHVVCTMGTQRAEMQDATWTNETMTATTDNPVVVSDGETRLQAASMAYRTDSKELLLRALSGSVSMKPPAGAAAPPSTAGAFDFLDVKKGGLGEFLEGQLQRITDGVEIALRPSDPDAKPMQLAASAVRFAWDPKDRTKPKAIQLVTDVLVDGPQGIVHADRADLDLAENKLTFAGKVHGKSDAIESFNADRIVYDIKTGDSEMTGLVARGISMGAPDEDAKAGTGEFSRMNIERAGTVVWSAGQVKSMGGGVAITLDPRDKAGKSMALNASEATFSWSGEGGKPVAIALRGNVRVDGPQGAIRADRGDFDLVKRQFVFAGKVNGSLPQLDRFDADKVTYNVASGETLMANVTAKGLALAPPGKEKKPAEDADKKTGYSQLDIASAPEVSLTGQKLNWMRGGVALVMRSTDPGEPPMTVQTQELEFAYDKDQTSPRSIVLKKNVAMDTPDMRVNSDQAELNLVANVLTFNGNISGNTPQMNDFTATQFSYDMTTRRVTSKGYKAARVKTQTPKEETAP